MKDNNFIPGLKGGIPICQAKNFMLGLKSGLPICLGYIPIAFAFGLEATKSGLSMWVPIIISMTNLTSAGQFAGLALIVGGGSYIELGVTTLIINLRYMLMSFSLSQKLDRKINTLERCLIAFGNTDEIFAVAMSKDGKLKTPFMIGLIVGPYIGWAFGTILGTVASDLLPKALISALGITIYAMFIAIIIPAAKKVKPVLIAIILAGILSSIFKFTPFLNKLSQGWVIIIVTFITAGFCAYRFPISDKEEK